jgi:hypothetical protein
VRGRVADMSMSACMGMDRVNKSSKGKGGRWVLSPSSKGWRTKADKGNER